jgi:hypothetical protein
MSRPARRASPAAGLRGRAADNRSGSRPDLGPAPVRVSGRRQGCWRADHASGGEDAVLDREERGGTAGRDADLRVDVLRVLICGLGGDHEPVGDLPGGEAGCQQAEHLGITGGQSGRERGAGRRDGDLLLSAPALGQDPLYCLPVEAAGSAHRPQLDGSILGCVRGAIRAIRHVMA